MEYSAIIVAAGMGERSGLGYNKVLSFLGSSTVIEQSISLFIEDAMCKEIIVVVKESEQKDFMNVLHSNKIIYAYGGATRGDSVYSGLLCANKDYVLIHDGARPYLKKEELENLKDKLVETGACLLVVPVIDTIKIVKDSFVESTPLREQCFAAQTPQAFITQELIAAYDIMKQQDGIVSDDASVMERYGKRSVGVVIGSYENKKVTLPQDFCLTK